MQRRDVVDLLVLGALWGASFLFMRLGAHEFGPVALMAVRVAIAAVFLVAILAAREGLGELSRNAVPLLVVGTLNSALPFCLLAFATLTMTAGFASILNATAPLFAAIVAWVWLGERPDASRAAGLVVGFIGVVALVWGKAAFSPDTSPLAIPAALVAAALYGVAANYARRFLAAPSPLAVATGSQVAATLVLLPAAIALRPAGPVSARGWLAVVALGVACTGVAYILYFRLISRLGASGAIVVTFLIPVFGVLWGAAFLDEPVTGGMIGGSAVILLGTALATGLLALPASRRPRAAKE